MTTVAFFDLDYTLLDTSSGLLYLRESIKQKRISPWFVSQIGLYYQVKLLDFGQAHARLMTRIGRWGHIEAVRFFEEWLPRRLFPHLTRAGQARIERHQKAGHRVVLNTASIEEIVKPVARYLGLGGHDYLCTRLEVENGYYTGHLNGPTCYHSGKVYWANRWAAENGLDLAEITTYFYSDSSSDLPLLEQVTHPIAVNPSRKLARVAAARGWTVERFY